MGNQTEVNNEIEARHRHGDRRHGHCDFEIEPYQCELRGYLRASVYDREYPEGEQDALTILECNEDWYVKVEWKIWGRLRHHLCGYFCVCVYLESIGPGPDYNLDCDGNGQPCIEWIEMDPCGDGRYVQWCRIPAGTIDCGECGSLYDVAVTLKSFDKCKHPGHIAAYCKGPTLMFYEAPEEEETLEEEETPEEG